MSALGIGSTIFSLFNTASATQSAAQKSSVTTTSGNDFSSSLSVQMASMRAQTVNSLIGSVFSDSQNNTSSAFNALTGTQSSSTDPLSQLGLSNSTQGLSATGRNLSLFDPQSAYSMMSIINSQDTLYKAQYSELSAMQTAVRGMQQAGTTLAGTDATMSNEAITTRLQDFANKYNEWSTRFEGTVQTGGVLAGTQAAEISLYELENSVGNPFNGAKDGIHGLKDLGLTINPATNLASLDTTKLDAMLSSNKQAAVDAIDTFSANFAKSAELLNSPNNFIPNRLANLDKVITYVDKNETSLQAEFGLGDPAKPSANVAKALAAYNQTYGL
ncbi:MAG: flagellar filament capping protein FliD [Betaproteobacteria bacterium]